MKRNKLYNALAITVAFFITLSGCKPLIARYDNYSYTQLSSVKVDVINVLDKSTEEYTAYEAEVNAVLTEVHKAKEYDTHKPNNAVMAKMWAVMDTLLTGTQPLPVGGALKGIMPTWKKKGKLNPVFVQEAEAQIAEGFDLLMELESQKIQESNSRISGFLNK